MFHDETDRIPAFATAKAFVEFLAGRNRERRGFFVVKGTETDIIGTSFLQFDKFANDIYDVKTPQYLLYGFLGDHVTGRDCEYK
jgi:hypothetical protein